MEKKANMDTAGLTDEQRELLAYLLEEEDIDLLPTERIPRRPDLDELPLSFAQQRLWFLDQLGVRGLVYNIATGVRFKGRLDISALQRAITEISRRHEILRTVFPSLEGRPVQVILPATNIDLPLTDLRDLPELDRETRSRELAREAAEQSFDLSTGPLFRVKAMRLGEEEHILLLTMHHIISDGWSTAVLVREVAALYEAYSEGKPSPLAELPLQYADYAYWQRQRLQSAAIGEQISYWKQQLEGAEYVLEMPTDRARPAMQSYLGATEEFEVDERVSEGLRRVSRRESATMNMTLLAVYGVLLSRYSGQEEVMIGTPIAGRNRREVEGLIGMFVNTLAMRVRVGGRKRFEEVMRGVRETTLGGYENEEVPFERVVEEVKAERDLSRSPIFQVMFTLRNVPVSIFNAPGLKLELLAYESGTAKFDLNLAMEEVGDKIYGSLEYNTDLYEARTIRRMLRHFKNLLEAIIANPQEQVSRLPLLSDQERNQLLYEWNDTFTAYDKNISIDEVFQSQAAQSPDAVAVVFEDHSLTYEQLNVRANQLAHHLRQMGAGPESLIGVCLHRSIEMVVGLLAVLKSGGAYVPLEPTYPAHRLAFMIENAGIRIVLTEQSLSAMLRPSQARLVCLDADSETIAACSGDDPKVDVSGDNLAYMIYTSGSTGRPKGALIPHRGIYNRLMWMQQQYQLAEADRVMQKTPFSFDVSVWEFFWPLMTGARLVVARPEGHKDSRYLVEQIKRQGVSVLHFVPSMLGVMLEEEGLEECESVRLVVCSGEALRAEMVRRYHERMGGRMENLYGPTEASVDVTYWGCERGREDEEVAIGRPIANTQIYILDEEGEAVGVGVGGEIHIGGEGLGRGYHAEAGMTAERFRPDGYGKEAGGRLYKTGDKGRYREDGRIEYLGRKDNQVKVRGHRIEMGEIEAAMKEEEGIKQCVVMVREEKGRERRIVGYVEWKEGGGRGIEEVRRGLKGKLPEYMIPSAFVVVEGWPVTANGKLDRKSLPAPGPKRPDLGVAYVAPRNLIEELLASIWSQVLGVDRVGIHDDFFSLGGDSIRSVQVLALAKERGMDFSLQQLFQYQTIAELASKTSLADASSLAGSRTKPFSLISEEDRLRLPADVEDAYSLTMLQVGMLYHMELMPDSPVYHNVNSYHLKAPFDAVPFQQAVQRVVARHPILRTSFDLTSYSEPMQLVHTTASLEVVMEDIRNLSPDEQHEALARFFEYEKGNRFDFSKAPLTRFYIHRRTEESFQFTITEYHAVSDGWSLHANLAEIFDCYFALLSNEPPVDDAPLALSFRDYVLLERNALESEEARRYWDQQLADCTILELPRWSSKSASDGGQRVRRLSVPISLDVSDGLKQAARSLAVPIKSVLLAVHLKVLSLLSGQTDVMTGLVSNGRPEERDGEQIRGLFLNTLPFRVKTAPGTWADLVRSTFKAELEMLPFRRYPLMALQNQHGRTSLFDVMFNYTYFHVIDSLLESRRVEVLDNAFMSEETNFKLTPHFFLTPVLASVALDLDYDSTWFSDDQIKTIAGYYSAALEQVASHPTARHDVSSLLSDSERNQLLFEWNDTTTDCSRYKCVHEMFEAQVEQTPNATAVVFAGEQLSYRELNRRANQLAHYLMEKGAETDALIGLCLDRSLDMAIAVLAVLKAGAAYVPLDPAYPRERLSYMLEDAKPCVLVTQSWLQEPLSGHEAQVICLDAEWPKVAACGEDNPVAGVDADNLAYVIYTSGSTGNPKGIALPHRCLSNLIEWHFTIHSRASKTLQFASLSFDASFHEMFSAWCSGGTLFMISNALRMDLASLARFLHDAGVEKVTLPVVVLQQFSEEYADQPEVFSGLREIITTGEQLQISRSVINLFKSLTNSSLHNHYGPSETHVVTWLTLPDEPDSWETFPPIGQPIDNTQMHILDQSFNPVPVGVPGELYIGGVSLARGYLNQPGLSAEKFIPNPFATDAGARLYKTGDLARYRTDGNIDFLGRIDHQVKIRGFRVELGEIESVLGQHPSVLEVVVMAREDVPGEKNLVAYIVSDEQQAVASSQLRDYLMGKLPDYMVPSAFVIMKSLPLTANGKIDRRALPAPNHARPNLKKEFVAPRSAAEQVAAKIMARALGVEQIGVFDNFFELGGHSLMATRVLFRLREAFRVELPLPSLFENPTVEGVVGALAQIFRDREIVEQIAQTIQEIEQLSEEELNLMLAEQSNDEQAEK